MSKNVSKNLLSLLVIEKYINFVLVEFQLRAHKYVLCGFQLFDIKTNNYKKRIITKKKFSYH